MIYVDVFKILISSKWTCLKPAAHEVIFLSHCSNRPIESNFMARRRRGNAIEPRAAVLG
jgi:hypothetical protein